MYPGTSEVLGKGKRARIPNKRYSDILMSPTHSKKSIPFILENGNPEKLDSGNDTDNSIKEELGMSPNSRTSSPFLKRPRSTTDLTDPKFFKPFEFGWKRELVWRGTYDESRGRMGDIYYYTPQGKKVRSRREVVENLTNKELTIDNFTFFKEPLGLNDPEKEIVRDAKSGKGLDTSLVKQVGMKSLKDTSTASPRSPKLATPKITKTKLLSPKISSPKLASPKLASPKVATPKVTSPKRSSSRVLPTRTGLNETADSPAKTRNSRNLKIVKVSLV